MAWRRKEKRSISKDDVQFMRMPPLPFTCYTGGAYWLFPQMDIDFFELLNRIDTEDALDDFLAFKRSVMKVFAGSEVHIDRKPGDLFFYAGPEEKKRQLSHLFNHVVLYDVVKPGFNYNQTEGITTVSDVPNLNALSLEDINSYLEVKVDDVQRLDLVHESYAYRKGLAQCDFIKCDSNLEEALAKIKAETRWTVLPEEVLRSGLQIHIKQLKMLGEGETKPDLKDLLEKLNNNCASELARSPTFTYEAASCRFLGDVDFSYLNREFVALVLGAPKYIKFPISGGVKGTESVAKLAAGNGNLKGTFESLVVEFGAATRPFRGRSGLSVAAAAASIAGALLVGKVALSKLS